MLRKKKKPLNRFAPLLFKYIFFHLWDGMVCRIGFAFRLLIYIYSKQRTELLTLDTPLHLFHWLGGKSYLVFSIINNLFFSF